MHLTGFGHTGALRPVSAGTSVANGTRLEIIRPDTPVVRQPGCGYRAGDDRFHPAKRDRAFEASYTLSGNLQPVLAGKNVVFFDRYGPVMQYGGLTAQDAMGRALPAEITLSGNRLSWQIDDRNAVYPVTIDPYIATQMAILNASDKAANVNFGYSVSVYNSTRWLGRTRPVPVGLVRLARRMCSRIREAAPGARWRS